MTATPFVAEGTVTTFYIMIMANCSYANKEREDEDVMPYCYKIHDTPSFTEI
jgi:hypothetical protein